MKTLIKVKLIVVLIVFSYSAIGQTATFDQVASKKAKGVITEYITESGVVFKTGDTLKIGYPFRNDCFDLVNSTTNITLAALGGTRVELLTATSSGHIAIIKKMRCWQRKLQVTTYAKGESMGLSITNFEEAFKTGEIILPNYLTSDQALSSLKKAKDKLDLELITQEEYDRIKTELRKFIK